MSCVPPSTTPSATPHELSHPRFQDFWTVGSQFQRSVLCSLAVSTNGLWIASSSFDHNMIFIDFKTGQLVGVVDFQSRFNATSILWRSDNLLYVGSSTGMLFKVDYDATGRSLSMRPLFKESFSAPINALAFDPVRKLLAIGYGGDTSLYTVNRRNVLTLLEHIPAPTDGPQGQVTVLSFMGDTSKALQDRMLFIGHAKAGFCMWYGRGKFKRTPFDEDGVCTIGSAVFSSDGSFMAIATLDHSVVFYPMSKDGPVLGRRQVLPNPDHTGFRPIIPVALDANNLLLRGSTIGQVPIVDLHRGPLPPIETGTKTIIRALITHGDKLIVGLSDTNEQVSKIKCYLDRTSPIPKQARLRSDEKPVFQVTFEDIEKAPSLFRVFAGSRIGKLVSTCQEPFMQVVDRIISLLQSREVWIILGTIWMFVVILVVDPPELSGFSTYDTQTGSTHVSTTRMHTTRGQAFGESYPNLTVLLTYCGWFICYRFGLWGAWLVACFALMIGFVVKSFVYLAFVVPRAFRILITVVPRFLVATICDALQDIPVCPRRR